MTTTRRLWLGLGALLVVGFGVLLWMGGEIHRQAPPMPQAVVTERGRRRLHARRHRTRPPGLAEHRRPAARLDLGPRRAGRAGLVRRLAASRGARAGSTCARAPTTARPTPSSTAGEQARAAGRAAAADPRATPTTPRRDAHRRSRPSARRRSRRSPRTTTSLFSQRPGDARAARRRTRCAKTPCPTPRTAARSARSSSGPPGPRSPSGPASTMSYTNNWPYEPLVGNTPTSSIVHVDRVQRAVHDRRHRAAGLAPRGLARQGRGRRSTPPATDPLRGLRVTPSMQATAKYFWLVIALFLVQILLGAITAHYQVEGQNAYGFALADVLPYFADAHLAHAARGAVDRDRVARHGPVHRAGDLRARAEVPAARRQRAVRLPDRHRRRRVHRPVVRGDAEARPREQLLVRPPGLGVRRHRPLLADLPVHRPAALADAGRPRAVAGAAGAATRSSSIVGLLFLSTVASACSTAPA